MSTALQQTVVSSSPEFESVVIAALLHDIGKFYQRAHEDEARFTKHTELSGIFVDTYAASLANPALVRTLVRHHHESPPFEGTQPKDLSDPWERMLAYLVSEADNLSSSERDGEKAEGGYRPDAVLHALFPSVRIANPDEDQYAGNEATYFYALGRYLKDNMAPIAAKSPALDQNQYEQHASRFRDEFKTLFARPYPGMVDTLLFLIRKYLWCIPSDTTLKLRDISLADHLQTTCALAACMFRYHDEYGWEERAVRDNDRCRALLVGGDLSGIQDYIYGIATIGPGGVAKRLRGRSFKVGLLTDLCAWHLLRGLELPMACKIMSAGGQFYVVMPNSAQAQKRLEELRKEIAGRLLEGFHGALSLSIACEELRPDALRKERFQEALDAVKRKLDGEKRRKFKALLAKGPQVIEMAFHGAGACPVCEKNPAVPGADGACADCREDAELGGRLPKAMYLAITRDGAGDFTILDYGIRLLDTAPACTDDLFVWNIRPVLPPGAPDLEDNKAYCLLPGQPSGFSPYAGYVPVWKAQEDCDAYNAELKQTASRDGARDTDEGAEIEGVKSFRALAFSRESGAPRLGVLRADVDHLGLIFSLGMENRGSLSRLATLSNMLQAFFCGALPALIKKEYRDLYIAYAGGDDLMIVGPWEDTLRFSKRLQEAFAEFTAHNPAFTLSAAIGVYGHHAPVAVTAPRTGEMLEEAKQAGRNRLTVFETDVPWDNYPEVEAWAKLFTDELRDERSPFAHGFLYRLLAYQRQALAWYASGDADVRSLLYRPHLAYDVGRNFTNDAGEPRIGHELHRRLCGLLAGDTEDTWRLLGAPITWAALATRKGGK